MSTGTIKYLIPAVVVLGYWSMGWLHGVPADPGVYVLLISVSDSVVISTRSGRVFEVPRGVYLYVGSARGLGGLRARISRHLRKFKKPYWHIDYLLSSSVACVSAVLYRVVREPGTDYEQVISRELSRIFTYVPGFGCSDKRGDKSHLFRCGERADSCLNTISQVLPGFSILKLNCV